MSRWAEHTYAGLQCWWLGQSIARYFVHDAMRAFDFLCARPEVDPTRIAAQIVTGVGFLGAGAIMRQGSDVHGLTTAASIWVAASLGMAVGFGYYAIAAFTTFLVIVMLVAIRPVELRFFRRNRRKDDPPIIDRRGADQ